MQPPGGTEMRRLIRLQRGEALDQIGQLQSAFGRHEPAPGAPLKAARAGTTAATTRGAIGRRCGKSASAGMALAERGRRSVRAGYLHRRPTWETHGDVAFDTLLPDGAGDDDAPPCITSLTQIWAPLTARRIRCGFSFDLIRRTCLPRRCPDHWHA
jgi:hypothetical protein